jgi:uncharacterized protein (TIGR02118 family)
MLPEFRPAVPPSSGCVLLRSRRSAHVRAAWRLPDSVVSCTLIGRCQQTTARRSAMIKVSVMYPNTPGARFNHEYYRDKHMPLVKARMGDACQYYTVDKGLAGGAPGAPAPFVGMCHIYCSSVETFQAGFGPHAKEIMADIPNYTDISPQVQISEVVVG